MNYNDYINELAVLLPQKLVSPYNAAAPFVDDNYNQILPRCIEYAEGMMYRDPDLNFLYTRTVNSSQSLSAGTREFTLPANIIIAERINVIVPTKESPAQGTRIPYLPTSLDTIDFFWPQESATATPGATGYPGPYWAMKDNVTGVVAPTPDNTYTVEVVGIFRPPTLSSTNTSTYLTTNFPDLFIAASMIYMAGVQRDFGQQSDNPQLALSWQQQYDKLKIGAVSEAQRQRQSSANWTAYPQAPLATPPRS